MSRKRVGFRVVAAALGLAVLAGCGVSAPTTDMTSPPAGADSDKVIVEGDVIGDRALLAAAKKEGTVTLYTSASAPPEQQIVAKFTERFGIQVELVREVGGRLTERILTENKAGKDLADVVHMSDQALTQDLIKAGVVAEHTVPFDDQYPDHLKKSGLWYVPYMPLMYIVYNKEVLDPQDVPKTWNDLLDPKFQGKIGMTHAGVGGTGWALAYFWRTQLGEDYWKKMEAQKPVIYQAAANVTQAVIKGEVPLAVNADTTDYGEIEKGAPLGVVYPPEGVPAAPYTFFIAKKAPNPNAARLFANWYLSQEGQTRSADIRGSYSAHKGVKAPTGKPTPDQIKVIMPKDPAEFIRLRDPWVKEWNTVFGYR